MPALRAYLCAQYPNLAGDPDDAVGFHDAPRTVTVPDEPGVVAPQMLVIVPPTCSSADHVTGTTDAGRTVTSAQKPLPQSDAIAPVTRRFTGAGAGAGTGAGPGFGAVPSRPITTSLHE